jgi:N-methylhydantoinase A
LPPALIDEGIINRLLDGFHEEYVKRYGAGSIMTGTPVELVTVRAVGTELITHGELTSRSDTGSAPVGEVRSGRTRAVRFGSDEEAYVDVDVYDDVEFTVGRSLRGPALIDRWDTTIWVPEGVWASRDGNGSIILEVL